MSQAIKIFISYANEDESYKNTLLKVLRPLERRGIIAPWHDGAIEIGKMWEEPLKKALEDADVLIFLVSTDFADSEYINDVELKKAIERYYVGEVAIVPIYIRPLPFHDDFLDKFQALPKNRKAISTWSNIDEAWADVGSQLNKLFESLRQKKYSNDSNTTNTIITDNKPDIDKSPPPTSPEQQIRALISKGKTKEAIEALIEHTQHIDSDRNQEGFLLASRWNGLERQERLGLISYGEIQMERNRINAALLAILEDL